MQPGQIKKIKGVTRDITIESHKALIKYFEVKMKAGSEFDIK